MKAYGQNGCCDGCHDLQILPPARKDAPWMACCTDADKPMHGQRRVVEACSWKPFEILTPVWCKRGAVK